MVKRYLSSRSQFSFCYSLLRKEKQPSTPNVRDFLQISSHCESSNYSKMYCHQRNELKSGINLQQMSLITYFFLLILETSRGLYHQPGGRHQSSPNQLQKTQTKILHNSSRRHVLQTHLVGEIISSQVQYQKESHKTCLLVFSNFHGNQFQSITSQSDDTPPVKMSTTKTIACKKYISQQLSIQQQCIADEHLCNKYLIEGINVRNKLKELNSCIFCVFLYS